MSTSGSIINYVNQIKPMLKRIVPASVLRWGKQRVIHRITEEIQHTNPEPYSPKTFPWGINLIGPIDSATGLGQSIRLVARVVSETEVPFLIYNSSPDAEKRTDVGAYEGKIAGELKYSVNLWHINLSEFAEVYAAMGKAAFDKHYNIAFWLWELEEFPDEWVPYINFMDEIWTPSEFISNAIRRKSDKPVYTIPYYMTAKADTVRYGRSYFNLPEDKFLFLMMYDCLSVSERKNPKGAIKAFQTAFPPDREDVGLVIKVNSADEKELSQISGQTEGYRNVYLISRNLEKIEVNSLIADSDAFVSLHRAEGFGLVLAEAMLNGVPAVATNWSANTEFMDQNVACMVGYHMVTLDRDLNPYKKGNCWAEPDVDEAAEYMKRLVDDPLYYKTIADRAEAHIQAKLGLETVTALVENRINAIKDI